jgi:hypothetical protein
VLHGHGGGGRAAAVAALVHASRRGTRASRFGARRKFGAGAALTVA